MFAQLQSETPSLRTLIGVDDPQGEQTITWHQVLARGTALAKYRLALDWLRPSADDVTELMFTSGTTGEPKGVLHTTNTLYSAARATIRDARLTGDEVVHMASTLGHQTGFLYGVRLPLLLGATAVYQDRWDPDAFVRLVDEEHITLTLGAAPFLADTLRACRASGSRVKSLRTFFCGGAPIPKSLADEVVTQLDCRLVPCWGMTELAIVTSVQSDDPLEKVVTTDGRPCEEMEISLRDASGSELGPGQEGDLVARGAHAFVGYVQGVRAEQQVTQQFWPERLEVMSEFPMTPGGKVQKFELREMLARTRCSAWLVAA